jgi:predicted phage terminase large subunit-like protein
VFDVNNSHPQLSISLTGDKELDEVLVRAFYDTKFYLKTFHPEKFEAEFSPEIHNPIFAMIDSGKSNKKCIAAPRGIGKTSIAEGICCKNILYHISNFIVYVSNSATSAERQTENIKHELLTNRAIRDLFGNVKSSRADDVDDSFSKKTWAAHTDAGDTLILPRGSGQQIRGLLYRGKRPDFIVFDDLEDTETIANEEQRMKRKMWFFGDAVKATARFKKDWVLLYIDTLKHEDALLKHLLDSPGWDSVTLELCDDNYESKAPSFMTTEEIKAEAEQHREDGVLDVFYREYRNMPISTEDATFRPEYFKYYNEKDIGPVYNIVIVDPAKSVKLHSADSAVVCVGVSEANNALYVREAFRGKLHPDELYEKMFQIVDQFRAKTLAVEVTSLNEFITQPIRNEIVRRRADVEFIELNARGKKEERIASLVPYYRRGVIYHNPGVCNALENQLLGFPRSKYLDLMDALAYIVEVMGVCNIYLDSGSTAYVGGEDEEEYQRLYLDTDGRASKSSGWRFA